MDVRKKSVCVDWIEVAKDGFNGALFCGHSNKSSSGS
jgi:hypothetical protein